MKKIDLEQKIAELEGQIKLHQQENVEALKKEKQKLIQELFDKEKLVRQLNQTIEAKVKETQDLAQKFNELAKLFDEQLKTTGDIIEVEKLFLRNNIRLQELMAQKINAFNGEGEDKK